MITVTMPIEAYEKLKNAHAQFLRETDKYYDQAKAAELRADFAEARVAELERLLASPVVRNSVSADAIKQRDRSGGA